VSATPEVEATPGFAFAVLGPLVLRYDGQAVPVGSRKQRMLLACLLAAPNQVVPLSELAEVLWSGAPPPSAELTLRSLASRLRAVLAPPGDPSPSGNGVAPRGEDVLLGRDGGYLLRVAPGATDSASFERLLADGRAALAAGQPARAADALGAGLALWRGRAFDEVADAPLAEAVALRLEQARIEAVEELAEAQLAAGRPAQALATLEPHLAAHPFRERGWERLMLALYRLGRQADALSVYQRVRQRLRDELGVEPVPALRRLQRRILLQHRDLENSTPRVTGRAATSASAALPHALTPLVGRAGELGELTALLDRTRLLTLTGVGGVGKTRLALALAAATRGNPTGTAAGPRFGDGVWLVELAAVSDPGLVVAHAAATCGLPTAGVGTAGLLRQRLVDLFAEQEALVVFDNCEHVVEPMAELVEALLSGCPRLRVLATSREPLAVRGELTYPVPSLSLPPADAREPADLAASGAAELFCQRAEAAQVGFGATSQNVPAIASICRRLDGIPLALELAAGRMRAMAAQDIADRLDDRFRLLTGGPRTALPRHQTLHATLAWSYGLLSRAEQTLLCQLSVFPDTFDLAAAEAVGEPSAEAGPDRATGVAELVLRLVDKSLIDVRRSDGSVRYRQLETVKAYCREQSHLAPEMDEAKHRHYTHYLELVAAQRAASPSRWDTPGWLRHTLIEDDNYRAAIVHGLAEQNRDAALLLLCGIWHTWLWTGHAENVVEWLDQSLAGPATDGAAQVEAAIALAFLSTCWGLGGPERLKQLYTQARELADQVGDPGGMWNAEYLYAEFLLQRGELAQAKAGFFAAEQIASHPAMLGWCHLSLGWVAMGEGDLLDARIRFQSAADLGHHSGPLIPHALAALAPLTALAGDTSRATELAGHAITAAEELPLSGVWAMALLRAAQTQLLCADDDTAEDTLTRLFELLRRLQSGRFQAEAFEALAVLVHHRGDPIRAARYLGVSARIRGARIEDHAGVDVLEALVRAARTEAAEQLGRSAYDAAENAGRALAPTTALTEARAALNTAPI
jgi:predicted ATPase/DNA-binding SARP family transcriptional activator